MKDDFDVYGDFDGSYNDYEDFMWRRLNHTPFCYTPQTARPKTCSSPLSLIFSHQCHPGVNWTLCQPLTFFASVVRTTLSEAAITNIAVWWQKKDLSLPCIYDSASDEDFRTWDIFAQVSFPIGPNKKIIVIVMPYIKYYRKHVYFGWNTEIADGVNLCAILFT